MKTTDYPTYREWILSEGRESFIASHEPYLKRNDRKEQLSRYYWCLLLDEDFPETHTFKPCFEYMDNEHHSFISRAIFHLTWARYMREHIEKIRRETIEYFDESIVKFSVEEYLGEAGKVYCTEAAKMLSAIATMVFGDHKQFHEGKVKW